MHKLSKREIEVLRLYAQGNICKVIAYMLYIEPITVKTHLSNARKKLEAVSTRDACILAYRSGYIELSDILHLHERYSDRKLKISEQSTEISVYKATESV